MTRTAVVVLVVGLAASACGPGAPLEEFAVSEQEQTTTTASETSLSTPGSIALDAGSTANAYPPQPDGLAFPVEAWPEGAPPSEVIEALDDLLDRGVRRGGYGFIHSVVVVHEGRIVAEEYRTGAGGIERVQPGYGIAATAAGLLVGVAADERLIDVYNPAWVDEWQADSSDDRGGITPNVLLRMVAGLDWTESIDVGALSLWANQGGAATLAINREVVAQPWAQFAYSSGNLAIISRLLGDRVGRGTEFVAWADERLFSPLGVATDFRLDADDYWIGSEGPDLTARDFARVGLLLARGGRWNGELLLPRDWVDFMRLVIDNTEGYGAGLWIDDENPARFGARGAFGQRIEVDTDQDLVVVVLSNSADPELTDLFVDEVVALFEG